MNEEQLDQREAQLAARLARLGELESRVLRREKAHPLISTDAHPGILGALPAPEEGRLNEVMGMLDEMDETLRVPMVLFYVEGFTVREIARTLRIPEGTVKSRLWNGRKTLREMMLEEAL